MRHKPSDASGGIMISYIDGELCHDFVPVSVQQTRGKVRVDVSLVVESDCRSWAPRSPRRIRKVILKADVAFSRIVDELSRFYSLHGRRIVATCMQLNGESKRHEIWTNPLMSEALARMQQTRDRANQADGNESAKRFWMKSLRLDEFEVGLSFEVLENEVKNFSGSFELC